MKKTKKSSKKKSHRKLSKKASAYTKKRKHHVVIPEEWVMPFDASFPRENSVDFILDEDDEDRAVIFQYDGEFDE